jgi:hypothetical protein
MSPSLMSINRLTIFMAVVFPAPDGPTRQQMSPAGIVSDRSLIAGPARPGYRFVTWSKTISAAAPLTVRSLQVSGPPPATATARASLSETYCASCISLNISRYIAIT